MDVGEYQNRTINTAIYKDSVSKFTQNITIDKLWHCLRIHYVGLGLAGEAGEVAGLVKKYIRDDTPWYDFTNKMSKELGDVLWYVSEMCNELGLDMAQVMEENLEKLEDRKNRNVLGGSGDER